MKHILRTPATPAAIADAMQKELPQYQVEIKKNPLLGFEYVEVRKSAYAGAWIRIKNEKVLVNSCIPSAAARAFLGGLLLLLITYSSRKEVATAAGDVVTRNF